MTLFGKILVYLNVLFSFLMLSWAAALYTNRINWTATGAKDGKPEGVLVGRQKRVNESHASLKVSEGRWNEAVKGFPGDRTRAKREGLLDWDKRRLDDQAWYTVELLA